MCCNISTKLHAQFLTQHNVETTIEQSAKQIQGISLWPVSDRTLKHIHKKLVSHFSSKITTYQLHKLVSEFFMMYTLLVPGWNPFCLQRCPCRTACANCSLSFLFLGDGCGLLVQVEAVYPFSSDINKAFSHREQVNNHLSHGNESLSAFCIL